MCYLCRLICDPKHRLGKNGITDFQKHPFFQDINFDDIRSVTPPYIPEYSSPTDTRNFDLIEDEETAIRGHYVSRSGWWAWHSGCGHRRKDIDVVVGVTVVGVATKWVGVATGCLGVVTDQTIWWECY